LSGTYHISKGLLAYLVDICIRTRWSEIDLHVVILEKNFMKGKKLTLDRQCHTLPLVFASWANNRVSERALWPSNTTKP